MAKKWSHWGFSTERGPWNSFLNAVPGCHIQYTGASSSTSTLTLFLMSFVCAHLIINRHRALSAQNVTHLPNRSPAPGELTFHSVGGPWMSLALVPQYCRARWRHSVPNSRSDSLHCRGDTTERRGWWHFYSQSELCWSTAVSCPKCQNTDTQIAPEGTLVSAASVWRWQVLWRRSR